MRSVTSGSKDFWPVTPFRTSTASAVRFRRVSGDDLPFLTQYGTSIGANTAPEPRIKPNGAFSTGKELNGAAAAFQRP